MSVEATSGQLSGENVGPTDKQLKRLVVEAAGYLGKEAGDTIPVEEVRLQAEANGYTGQQITAMLEANGLSSATKVRVPEQGLLFGELWSPSSDGVPDPETPHDTSPDSLTVFREWCEERAKKEETHSYTRKEENRRYGRAKDVDRHFIKEYDTFSTVLLTYDAGEPVGESVVEHSQKFYPRPVVRNQRRILKRLGVFDEYAGISLLAPKRGDRVPDPESPLGYTHAHTFLWIPGEVSAEDFHPLVEKHVEYVDGATKQNHPLDRAVSVQVHDSSEVGSSAPVLNRGSGLDQERGVTTALPQEVGANLPLLRCKFDARGAPDYVEEWCAHLRLGTDGTTSTRGITRFRRLGHFGEYADGMKWKRRLRLGTKSGKALAEYLQ